MWKIFGAYLKAKRRNILPYIITMVFLSIVFYLNDIEKAAVLYAYLLIAVLLCGYVLLDFLRFLRRHQSLTEQLKMITLDTSRLPEPDGLIERDYQALIEELFLYKTGLESDNRIAQKEMIDYYSLWVHQIKTPISAMRLLLQSDKDQYPRQRELSAELFKIEQYVEMVLSYLRVEEMTGDLLLRQYPLHDIVTQAIRKYSQLFILSRLKLEYEEISVQVLTDKKWLVLVLEQIISNALKYTKEGCVRIYMEPAKEATLVIEDTGIGIWEEDLPRVFEKGFTGYNGRGDKKSTGIGLYLCKRILDKLGHQIAITSAVSKGTKVAIDLSREPLI